MDDREAERAGGSVIAPSILVSPPKVARALKSRSRRPPDGGAGEGEGTNIYASSSSVCRVDVVDREMQQRKQNDSHKLKSVSGFNGTFFRYFRKFGCEFHPRGSRGFYIVMG